MENCQRNAKWLRSLDNNRLLHTFRLNAGIASKAKPFEGCEAPDIELRGHITGHVLSSHLFPRRPKPDGQPLHPIRDFLEREREIRVCGSLRCFNRQIPSSFLLPTTEWYILQIINLLIISNKQNINTNTDNPIIYLPT